MRRLVLVGAVHAHAQVLKGWIAAPLRGAERVLISPSALVPFSGMVPRWLTGHCRLEDICIDFSALAAAARARLVIDELVALEPNRRRLQLRSGSVLDYDVLSLNVGSTLRPTTPADGIRMLPLRPLAGLRHAWESMLVDISNDPADAPMNVTAVGGGAAGVEALLATLAHLRQWQPKRTIHGCLVSAGAALLPGMSASAVRHAQAALKAADVSVRLRTTFSDTERRPNELVLRATGAQAHAWQSASGLSVSAGGFIRVDRWLRSVSHHQVHAVGDCAEWIEPLPKAGVYAVRMGSVLSVNLRAALGAGSLAAFEPQQRFLSLQSTADGRAIASWGRWSVNARWVGRWKNHIDRAFLQRFALTTEAPTPHSLPLPGDSA